MWDKFRPEFFVPIEKVVEVVMMLLDKASSDKPLIGQTVELSGTKHYFRTQVDYCDEAMAAVMGSTGVTEQGVMNDAAKS